MEHSQASQNRRFPRTDRPGSGLYRGESPPGVAFDDYRATDEYKIHHRHEYEKKGFWRGMLSFLRLAGPSSEERSVRRAQEAIARDPTLEIDHVKISAHGDTLTVSGSVPTRWMKERITDCLLNITGLSSINNELYIRAEHTKLPQEGSLSARP